VVHLLASVRLFMFLCVGMYVCMHAFVLLMLIYNKLILSLFILVGLLRKNILFV